MLEVEGGTDAWCMKILRHEAGHAIDNAYRLQRRRKRHKVFGHSTSNTRSTMHPSRTAGAFVHTSTCGTRRAIRRRTSPRPSRVWLTPDAPVAHAVRGLARTQEARIHRRS